MKNKISVLVFCIIGCLILSGFFCLIVGIAQIEQQPSETVTQTYETYDGKLEYVYENINKYTYLRYDPVSEVCYRTYKYEYATPLYYGDNLLHYCPHKSQDGLGTFYILVDNEPVIVDITQTSCPFDKM